ncbi:hypothetical protein Tco_0807989 [Tanacetum coccineum]
MVRPQFWQIQAHNDPIHDLGVEYATYLNLFTMTIHHNGEFSKPPSRRYKFVELDYVNLVYCNMFSINEELCLRYNNKILFTHFRIPGISLDDGLVSLMADDDVIKLLNYVPGCNLVVIEEIVEDNVVSSSEKDSRLEWPGMGAHGERNAWSKLVLESDGSIRRIQVVDTA